MFDEKALKAYLEEHKIELLGELPMLPEISAMSQTGQTDLDNNTAEILAHVGEKVLSVINQAKI